MSLARVEVTQEVYLAILSHALSTEAEEVMGLLLGNVQDGPQGQQVARVWMAYPQIRTDRRKDRVESSPEQMARCSAHAERLSRETGVATRVVGWYHSHPHITVLPSHVDVQTQAMYQMLDPGFIGLIFSVFNTEPSSKTGSIQLTAFQSQPAGSKDSMGGGLSTPLTSGDFANMDDSLAAAIKASTAALDTSPSAMVRKEVPLIVAPGKTPTESSLHDYSVLHRVLAMEERGAYTAAMQSTGSLSSGNTEPSRAAPSPSVSLARLHHASCYQQGLAILLEGCIIPALHSMDCLLAQQATQERQLRARNASLKAMLEVKKGWKYQGQQQQQQQQQQQEAQHREQLLRRQQEHQRLHQQRPGPLQVPQTATAPQAAAESSPHSTSSMLSSPGPACSSPPSQPSTQLPQGQAVSGLMHQRSASLPTHGLAIPSVPLHPWPQSPIPTPPAPTNPAAPPPPPPARSSSIPGISAAQPSHTSSTAPYSYERSSAPALTVPPAATHAAPPTVPHAAAPPPPPPPPPPPAGVPTARHAAAPSPTGAAAAATGRAAVPTAHAPHTPPPPPSFTPHPQPSLLFPTLHAHTPQHAPSPSHTQPTSAPHSFKYPLPSTASHLPPTPPGAGPAAAAPNTPSCISAPSSSVQPFPRGNMHTYTAGSAARPAQHTYSPASAPSSGKQPFPHASTHAQAPMPTSAPSSFAQPFPQAGTQAYPPSSSMQPFPPMSTYPYASISSKQPFPHANMHAHSPGSTARQAPHTPSLLDHADSIIRTHAFSLGHEQHQP